MKKIILALLISILAVSGTACQKTAVGGGVESRGTDIVAAAQPDTKIVSYDEELAQYPQYFGSAATPYLGEITGEIAPKPQSIFQGAWYCKLVSSEDYWRGMDIMVTLPEVQHDPLRANPDGGKYMDNPSFYMGATGLRESDVGLTWERICEDTDPINPSISMQGMAFRPFWRYITSSGANMYNNADKFDYWTYFFPGDTVRMVLFASSTDNLRLYVKLMSPTTIPKYQAIRARFNINPDQGIEFLTPEFQSQGQLDRPMSFKQVNAIDQSANEGKPTQPSKTIVSGAVYHYSYLFRDIDGTVRKVPYNRNRYSQLSAPVAEGFVHKDSYALNLTKGFRTVDIVPGNAVNYKA